MRNRPRHFSGLSGKSNLLSYFTLKQAGPNHFILLNNQKDKDLIGIKTQIGEIKNKLFDALKQKIRGKYSFKNAGTISNINGLKITIYKELKNNVTDPQERAWLYEISQQIEQEENISDHLINLIDTSLSKGYGLWKAEKISRQIKIDNISFPANKRKISWLYNGVTDENITIWDDRTNQPISQGARNIFICNLQKEKDGKEEQASLSVNIQLSRDTRNKKGQIFLKVQLLNTSTPFQDADAGSRYYSTFNEVVNQRSFFGVKLSLTSPYLLPYNRFDREYDETAAGYDEDMTTKFIYNQFRDYGIGHSCSVKWDAGACTVETEYIPTCETPDVDPPPRGGRGGGGGGGGGG
ncbi:MAG: hypothetical protein LUH15_19695, partial [Tannerellaceae bacterium]|nr:hypothetical protein [Tannerellaceae bacterium]